MEKVDLEKVQQAVERDKAQCERVSQLWKEFDNYCTDAINTIALADPLKDSDVVSLQTWVQVALEEIVSPVILIAETFQDVYKNMTDGILANPDCQQLCKNLGDMARKFIGDPVKILQSSVSKLQKNLFTVAGTVAFIVILGIFVGSVFMFFMTLIDVNKGSLSKIAKELRQTSKKLQKELDKWLDTFGQSRS